VEPERLDPDAPIADAGTDDEWTHDASPIHAAFGSSAGRPIG
jgi:hypothetical protein